MKWILQVLRYQMITINHKDLARFGLFPAFVLTLITLVCSDISANANETTLNTREPIEPLPTSMNFDVDKAALGERLFNDQRLSLQENISCASCHYLDQSGDDNRAIGLSASTDGIDINTPTIFNAVFNFRQNWNGSAKTLQQQIEHVIESKYKFNNDWDNIVTKLNQDSELNSQFRHVYNDDINKENIISAITEFEKTLITPNAAFDRYLRNEENAISEEAKHGYRLFKDLGCVSCHQGINIGGNLFQKFGVFHDYFAERGDIKQSDLGRINLTGRKLDTYVFKVPSLRNVTATPPYLHDGSAETIEEAITIMGKTQLGKSLNDEEITLIKAFLETLTGEYKGVPVAEGL